MKRLKEIETKNEEQLKITDTRYYCLKLMHNTVDEKLSQETKNMLFTLINLKKVLTTKSLFLGEITI